MPGTLYVVATPIGNLGDITLRALETLRTCDAIACEDTRVTSKLLAGHEISKPLKAIHEHSSEKDIAALIDRVKNGEKIAYVSDAGTPGVNDPGGKCVSAAIEAGVRVEPIPGVSALTTVISVCGFPMDDFRYLGFIPHKKGRQTFFKAIADDPDPTIFLESTHRIEKTLLSLEEILQPTRQIFVGRELTKMHETLYRGTVAEVRQAILKTSIKGEFTIIVGKMPKA